MISREVLLGQLKGAHFILDKWIQILETNLKTQATFRGGQPENEFVEMLPTEILVVVRMLEVIAIALGGDSY